MFQGTFSLECGQIYFYSLCHLQSLVFVLMNTILGMVHTGTLFVLSGTSQMITCIVVETRANSGVVTILAVGRLNSLFLFVSIFIALIDHSD